MTSLNGLPPLDAVLSALAAHKGIAIPPVTRILLWQGAGCVIAISEQLGTSSSISAGAPPKRFNELRLRPSYSDFANTRGGGLPGAGAASAGRKPG